MNFISQLKQGLLHIASLALVVGLVVAMPQAASANTGAGATILNVVTVNYKDASGVTSYAETATSSVTVTLVVSVPTLTVPVDQNTTSGGTVTYTYKLTSTANGSDVYDITTPNITSNATGTSTPSVTSVTLGSSVITAVTAPDTIEIPAGSETNLAATDIVVINGNSYVVSSVTPGTTASHVNTPADGVAGTTTPEKPTVIVLAIDAAGSNVTPALTGMDVGLLAAEQATITVDVTGTVTGTGSGTITTTLTVDSNSAPTGVPATDATTSAFSGPNLSITKEVSTDGGATFAASGSGAPGSTLTYRITVNNSGAGSATSVVITDPMPLYTTYTAGTAKNNPTASTYAAAATTLTDTSADGPGEPYNFTGTTATLNVGTLAGGSSSVLFYQVTID